MSSAWRRTSHLHLGQGLALVSDGRGDTLVLRTPSTLPLEQVLERTLPALPKQSKLRVTLSAALCPAISFSTPQGVKNWRELEQVALAAAAAAMDLGVDQVQCELQASGVAAGVPKLLLDDLQNWSMRNNFHLASIRPLWAVASQSAAARRRDVHALVLHEPDATTFLAELGNGSNAASVPRAVATHEFTGQAHRWQADNDLEEGNVLKMTFNDEPGDAPAAGAPSVWPLHWAMP